MSLILDALNRADQERSVENHTPNLQSAHYTAPASRQSLRRWIIEAVVVAAVISGFYFYSQLDPPATSTPLANSNTMPVSEQPVNTPTTAVSKPPTTLSASATNTENKPEVAIKVHLGNGQKNDAPLPAADAAIDSLYRQRTATKDITASVAEPAAKAVNAVTPTKQTAAEKTQTILASIPLLSQQSLNFQRRIPSIEYSVHAYAEGGGFVMLNGERFRVGDKLQPQLRVIAILPDSLVLDYQGRQFRLLALNSWINI